MRFIFIIIFISFSSKGQNLYFPGKLWEEKSPESQGIDIKKLDKAIEFAISNENAVDKDLRISIIKSFGREPGYKIKGPTKKRGDSNGLIIKNGYIIGKWGDTKRVDMTFSVTKSYLSTVAGIAYDKNLISIDDKFCQKMMRTLIKKRCPNRLERKKTISQKVMFFHQKTPHFEDPRVQNPSKNLSKITSKFKLEKVMLK